MAHKDRCTKVLGATFLVKTTLSYRDFKPQSGLTFRGGMLTATGTANATLLQE